MLEKYYDYKETAKILLKHDEFRPFPKYEDRDGWAKLYEGIRKIYLDEGMKKKIMDYVPKAYSATDYMNFYRTKGEGANLWQSQTRRDYLFDATIAECVEGKGEYIDRIIDLVWLICEESTWVVPSHNNHMHNHMWTGVMKNALPDVSETYFIDLYSAICAGTLGWTYYFLKNRIDEESPLICKRIEYEIERRIITPFMTHDDLTWFGFYGHKINNWNPWILESIIPVCLFVIKDEDRRIEFMARVLEKFDIYCNNCTPDGAGDEGPSYWNVGGGTMLDVFEIIKDATGGKLNMMADEFPRNCGEYIANANMCGDRYANFADGSMDHDYSYFVYRYSRLCNSPYLKDFSMSRKNIKRLPPIGITTMYRDLKCLFEYQEIIDEPTREFKHKDIWLPQGQQLFVRSKDERVSLAAKGGYNNESHNHNDLGHFIYMVDGSDVLCDLGGLRYTARAFSPYRYEFWIVNSTAHNCLTIGGYDQHNGDQYKSYEVSHELNDNHVNVAMDISEAYEKAAGVTDYVRTFDFEKENGALEITDDFKTRRPVDANVHFMTQHHNVVVKDGEVDIVYGEGKKVTVRCESDCKPVITLERHFNISFEKEHYMKNDVLQDGENYCQGTRIVFTFPEKVTERRIRTFVTHNEE